MSIIKSNINNINKQATINIGTIGHVAHGKSSIIKSISGINTVRFKNEMIRNITIKLGYASAKIFKCNDPNCPRPKNYKSAPSEVENEICHCGSSMTLKKHISFVDCPGHEILMSTMLSGTSVMDAAFLTIAANESCPQPQTAEHLAAIEIMGLDNIMILQNKIDLVKEKDAICQYDEIKNFVKGTKASDSPIIPICAQLGYNIDILCEYIVKKIPEPARDLFSPPRMTIVRSFDVNKPGNIKNIDNIRGGVIGGSIIRGILKIGDKIEIKPGIITKDENGNNKCIPILSNVVSLFSGSNSLEYAIPGGLIGIGTNIDPYLTKGDKIVGHLLGLEGTLPDVYEKIEIEYYLMNKVLGVKDIREIKEITDIKIGEILTINISSTTTGGRVMSFSNKLKNTAKLSLSIPICASLGDKISISRRIGGKWRLVGWGKISNGKIV